MVVKLRLQRWGQKNLPFYRLVAAYVKAPRDGKFLEILGTYDPVPNKQDGLKHVRLKDDRIKYWLSVGAQPSDRVQYLLGEAGLLPKSPAVFRPFRTVPKKDRPKA